MLLPGKTQSNGEQSSASRNELDEAERLCAEAQALVGPSESRVSQLWLGPLYLEVLLEQLKCARLDDDEEKASRVFSDARQLITAYEQLVTNCQSPRFSNEAKRLRGLIDDASQS